jgi:hypothetical protein
MESSISPKTSTRRRKPLNVSKIVSALELERQEMKHFAGNGVGVDEEVADAKDEDVPASEATQGTNVIKLLAAVIYECSQ